MKNRTILVVLILATAGLVVLKKSEDVATADFRDAVWDNWKFSFSSDALPKPTSAPVNITVVKPAVDVEWVPIKGGSYKMGSAKGYPNELPVHKVTLPDFHISKTPVTVAQYQECVKSPDAAIRCEIPGEGAYCNWQKRPATLTHPINCVDWEQAQQYARFKAMQPGFEDARLPTEAEWEYAAKSAGKQREFPWGDVPATCERAVMQDGGKYGCGADGTMPVCSKPKGNTEQGLCDMAGNVWQWVQDDYQNTYTGAPADGSALAGSGSRYKVMRGGSYGYEGPGHLRSSFRSSDTPDKRRSLVGFRLAR